MARVAIKPVEDLQWQYGPDPADPRTGIRAGRRVHHPGAEDAPQLFEVMLPPHRAAPPHAHEHDEIIYILAGELHLGDTVLRPGSSLAVPRETLYGFKAGPDGVHFLNFRPSQAEGLLTVEQVKARRRARPA